MVTGQPYIRLIDIWKSFGTVQALAGASLECYEGEIHIILGENGAGKTSLMSVLAGLYQPERGEVRINDNPVTIRSPRDALTFGVAMVHQHFEQVQNMKVWENVVLGYEDSKYALNSQKSLTAVQKVANEQKIAVDCNARVDSLAIGQQQKVEILKLLYRNAKVLILDEPTTFLTPQETDTLFMTLKELAGRGLAVLIITHKIRDALNIGDRLTVMRAGKIVSTMVRGEATEDVLVRQLMGDEKASKNMLTEIPPCADELGNDVLFEVAGLSTKGDKDQIALQDINFKLVKGEIRGIAGIAGSGQKQLAEALIGLLALSSGSIFIDGENVTELPVSGRIDSGICLIPQDRLKDGTLPNMSLWETFVLGVHRQLFSRMHFSSKQAMDLGNNAIREYEIKARDVNVKTAYLSGGNIQKVLVARTALAAAKQACPVIIAANPTEGLDIRTVSQVHTQLRNLAKKGAAVLMMSEDLDELMGNCHRISIIYRGGLVAEFNGPKYERYEIGEAMLGKV